jgi:hypothetical protein
LLATIALLLCILAKCRLPSQKKKNDGDQHKGSHSGFPDEWQKGGRECILRQPQAKKWHHCANIQLVDAANRLQSSRSGGFWWLNRSLKNLKSSAVNFNAMQVLGTAFDSLKGLQGRQAMQAKHPLSRFFMCPLVTL